MAKLSGQGEEFAKLVHKISTGIVKKVAAFVKQVFDTTDETAERIVKVRSTRMRARAKEREGPSMHVR